MVTLSSAVILEWEGHKEANSHRECCWKQPSCPDGTEHELDDSVHSHTSMDAGCEDNRGDGLF